VRIVSALKQLQNVHQGLQGSEDAPMGKFGRNIKTKIVQKSGKSQKTATIAGLIGVARIVSVSKKFLKNAKIIKALKIP
jgi:hypothetical protein